MNPFIYQRLKNKPGIWRVDGTSSVRDKGRLGTAVNLHFSAINVPLDQAYKVDPKQKKQCFPLSVHTAALSKFKVGSIWKDGELFHSPQLHQKSLTIDVSHCRLFRLNETVDLNGISIDSVIPSSHFDFGENREFLSKSFYAIVPVIDDAQTQWVVIPASEILRFYYGPSARLLANTIRGQIDGYISWDKQPLEDGHCVIRELQPLSKFEAAVLARAYVDPFAKSAMLDAHRHLSATNSNSTLQDKSLVIKSSFPFKGRTTLLVAGKSMSMADAAIKKDRQWGIFAMEILRCTHAFGFSSLTIEDQEIQYQGTGNSNGSNSRPPSHIPRFDPLTDLPVTDTGANSRMKRHLSLVLSNPYAALDNMRFRHIHLENGHRYRKSNAIDIPVNALTFGNGTSSKEAEGNLGLDIHNQLTTHVDSALTIFLTMLDHLRNDGKHFFGFEVSTRAPADKILNGTEIVAMFPRQLEGSRTWHLISDESNNIRTRQLVIAELRNNDKYFYILEMELKAEESSNYCTLLLQAADSTQISDQMFETLLKLTAIRKRWVNKGKNYPWKRDIHKQLYSDLMSKIDLHRFMHSSTHKTNPKSWAQTALTRINEIMF